MKTGKNRGFILALCAVIALASACTLPVVGSDKGSLSVTFGDGVSRSLLPGISMQPSAWLVSGQGPGGETFSRAVSGGGAEVQSLAFGEWTVTVEARNADGTPIGTGTGKASVHSGQTTSLLIAVRPFEGFGTLNLALGWNLSDIEVPQVAASLLPSSGSARTLAFALNGATASFSAQDVSSGYHTLSLKLLDNGSLAMGAVEIVRIVAGQATSGDFYFDTVNKVGGTISVNIDQDFSDPLTAVIAGAQASKAANKTLNLSASVAETGINASYVWYVNGDAKGTGATFAMDSSWAQGYYRIDVTAFSSDGKRAGSATAGVQVTAPSDFFAVSGTVRQDGSPVEGVFVSLAGGAHSATTDAAGIWTIDNLAPGTYEIATVKQGFSVVPDCYDRRVTIAESDLAGIDFTAFPFAATSISAIQGRAHISPMNNRAVTNVVGVVTLTDAKQFYIQSLDPDGDAGTSEGILIYQNSAVQVAAGDWVSVNGTVTEYIPSGAASGNLSVTEIKNPVISVLARGRPLPAPVVIGRDGRIPPTAIICDDANGPVDGSAFDPENDGIDFYESLEFMRVRLNDAQAVGPTIYYASSLYHETPLVGDCGTLATGMTSRGGIGIQVTDFNPEILIVNDKFKAMSADARVGDRFYGAIVGVLDYTYGVYKVYASESLPATVQGSLSKETTTLSGTASRLTVASYNTENLSVASPAGDIDKCAATIVDYLGSPDILVLCEVQDNNGPAAGDTDASITWNAIIAAIQARGGPSYQYRDIAPENNKDGGAPNGNIRQGFLFNPERAQFVDRSGGTATASVTVSNSGGEALLSFSPGRIDPTNAAFVDSRKPLVGEFLFQGKKLYVIGNHFNSKGGDNPLWGKNQPPVLSSEIQRNLQAALVQNFVQAVLGAEPQANIVLAGDFNDFEFSRPIGTLLGTNLTDLVFSLPKADRYSYVYSGNSQVLDHMIVSPSLAAGNPEFDIVHMNAEYPDLDRSSDHDPLVARFAF